MAIRPTQAIELNTVKYKNTRCESVKTRPFSETIIQQVYAWLDLYLVARSLLRRS